MSSLGAISESRNTTHFAQVLVGWVKRVTVNTFHAKIACQICKNAERTIRQRTQRFSYILTATDNPNAFQLTKNVGLRYTDLNHTPSFNHPNLSSDSKFVLTVIHETIGLPRFLCLNFSLVTLLN